VYDDALPTAFTMPGYTLVMTAVLGTLGDNASAYTTLYALNLLAALLSLLALYFLTVILLSKSTARIALLLAAVFPPLVAATATFGGTVWTHAVMLGALLLIARTDRGEGRGERAHQRKIVRMFLLAGLATGVWILFRGEALGAAVLIALWMWRKKDGSLRNAAVYLAAALLVLLPWTLRNTIVFERFVPLTTNFWLNAWRGNNESTTGGAFKAEGGSNWLTPELHAAITALPPSTDYELRVMDLYRARTLDFVAVHPVRTALLYLQKAGMFLTIDWSDPRARHPLFVWPQLLLMLLAFAGALLLWRRRKMPWPVTIVVLVTMLSVAALHVETRYILMMGILYIVFAATAVRAALARFLPDNESSAHA
jgi:4-amino-4-deoxy-L-arabinose transferase-like glycosyltransferase